MSITLPTNVPSGDRRTTRVALPAKLDPLHAPSRRPLPPLPLDIAVGQARWALEKYGSVSIHDDVAMVSAATALDGVLRDVLAALDAERAA